MDASHILTETQRAAGLRLIEPDDHIAQLVLDGCQVAVFSQNASISAIHAVADHWARRRQPCSA
jgi:hypothetical protein